MPTTNFEPKTPKLTYLPVKQIALNNTSQRPYEKVNDSPLSGDLVVRL